MNQHRFSFRAMSVLVLIALMLGIFSVRLFQLQVREATVRTDSDVDTFTYYTRVTAARGEILDRVAQADALLLRFQRRVDQPGGGTARSHDGGIHDDGASGVSRFRNQREGNGGDVRRRDGQAASGKHHNEEPLDVISHVELLTTY